MYFASLFTQCNDQDDFLGLINNNLKKCRNWHAKGAREARPFFDEAIFCTFPYYFLLFFQELVLIVYDAMQFARVSKIFAQIFRYFA